MTIFLQHYPAFSIILWVFSALFRVPMCSKQNFLLDFSFRSMFPIYWKNSLFRLLRVNTLVPPILRVLLWILGSVSFTHQISFTQLCNCCGLIYIRVSFMFLLYIFLTIFTFSSPFMWGNIEFVGLYKDGWRSFSSSLYDWSTDRWWNLL